MGIKRTWGKNPELIKVGPIHKYRERKLLRYIIKYPSSGIILDAGSGSGSMSISLTSNNFRVKAIDIDYDCAKYLDKQIKALGLQNKVKVINADVNNIPFPDRYFDGIVAGELLEHVIDDCCVVKELVGFLSHRGIVW